MFFSKTNSWRQAEQGQEGRAFVKQNLSKRTLNERGHARFFPSTKFVKTNPPHPAAFLPASEGAARSTGGRDPPPACRAKMATIAIASCRENDPDARLLWYYIITSARYQALFLRVKRVCPSSFAGPIGYPLSAGNARNAKPYPL
jgi:hypothetical protein